MGFQGAVKSASIGVIDSRSVLNGISSGGKPSISIGRVEMLYLVWDFKRLRLVVTDARPFDYAQAVCSEG